MSRGPGPFQQELLKVLATSSLLPRTTKVAGRQLALPAQVSEVAVIEHAMAEAKPFARTTYDGRTASAMFRGRFAAALHGLLMRGQLVAVVLVPTGDGAWTFVDADPEHDRSPARGAQPRFVRCVNQA